MDIRCLVCFLLSSNSNSVPIISKHGIEYFFTHSENLSSGVFGRSGTFEAHPRIFHRAHFPFKTTRADRAGANRGQLSVEKTEGLSQIPDRFTPVFHVAKRQIQIRHGCFLLPIQQEFP